MAATNPYDSGVKGSYKVYEELILNTPEQKALATQFNLHL